MLYACLCSGDKAIRNLPSASGLCWAAETCEGLEANNVAIFYYYYYLLLALFV